MVKILIVRLFFDEESIKLLFHLTLAIDKYLCQAMCCVLATTAKGGQEEPKNSCVPPPPSRYSFPIPCEIEGLSCYNS